MRSPHLSLLAVLLGSTLGACGEDAPAGRRPLTADAARADAGPADAGAADADPDAAAPAPVVGLFADTNRDGVVDPFDSDETQGKDQWTWARGALFLPNIDDDERRCPTRGTDAQLAGCHDAMDDAINGDADLADLARLRTAPWPEAPDGAVGRLQVEGAEHIRLFVRIAPGERAESFRFFDPATDHLDSERLRTGAELALEGRDIVRDAGVWDGTVRVGLTVDVPGQPTADADTVALRQAPLLLRHHLDPATVVYAARIPDASSRVFRNDLDAAITEAGLPAPLRTFIVEDQWTQDHFENGYLAIPAAGGGVHALQVYLRSANTLFPESLRPLFARQYALEGEALPEPLREAGRVVYTALRGPNVAGLTQFLPDKGQPAFDLAGHDLDDVLEFLYATGRARREYPEIYDYLTNHSESDTLDSFGNTETVPPHPGHPFGRILRGTRGALQPDPSVTALFAAQGAQPLIELDTRWLLVGHVDEFVSFIQAPTPRGWALVLNDPGLARQMLQGLRDQGGGDTPLFVGKRWGLSPDECTRTRFGWSCPDPEPAEITTEAVLADPDVMAATARAAVEIDAQWQVLQDALDLSEEEIVRLPFLHEDLYGGSMAYQPGTINGISLGDNDFGSPDPHGPLVDGQDLFKTQMIQAFAPFGVTVHWIENWDLYHVNVGEVHCGSNVERALPARPWWEEGSR